MAHQPCFTRHHSCYERHELHLKLPAGKHSVQMQVQLVSQVPAVVAWPPWRDSRQAPRSHSLQDASPCANTAASHTLLYAMWQPHCAAHTAVCNPSSMSLSATPRITLCHEGPRAFKRQRCPACTTGWQYQPWQGLNLKHSAGRSGCHSKWLLLVVA